MSVLLPGCGLFLMKEVRQTEKQSVLLLYHLNEIRLPRAKCADALRRAGSSNIFAYRLVITAAGSNGMMQQSNSSGSTNSIPHEPPCTSMGITD